MSAHAEALGVTGGTGKTVKTDIPARLDRLPWSRWHWMVVLALGITWILDGLEVTLVGSIAAALTEKETLGLTDAQAALAGTFYLLGAVTGALFFGYLTDRLGRKKLFMITLGVYLVFTVATAFAWDFASFAVFRVLAGMGIGGEYAAINSAIDELVPARVRGRVALAINSSWWIGAAISAGLSVFLLNVLAPSIGWRVAFALGGILAVAILLIRRIVPESPRWLLTHGRADEAERIVHGIEEQVRKSHPNLPEPEGEPLEIEQRRSIGFLSIARHVVREYPSRGVLGLSLMIAQAFLYNAVFFTYGLVLANFFDVGKTQVGLFLIPFAIGNLLGPWLLGPLFDSLGRRAMISSTYVVAGLILAVTAWMFQQGMLTALTLTAMWSVCFFFASAGASAAYLTVSEIFPMETRAMAIALFYAVATGINVLSPWFYGTLIGTGDPTSVAIGFGIGAAMMVAGGIVAFFLAVNAERRSLEDVARPLTAVRAPAGKPAPVAAGARAL